MSSRPSIELREFLKLCTVRLEVPAQSSGTGFFVAPRTILTCAHVVEPNGPVKDPSQAPVPKMIGGLAPRDVDAVIANHDLDLAVVHLKGEAHDPCVLLEDAADPQDEVWTFGYAREGGEPFAFKVIDAMPGDKGGQWWKLDGVPQPGLSGSPALNLRTGRIFGVLKRKGLSAAYAVRIGLVVALDDTLLKTNRKHHEEQDDWVRLLSFDQLRRGTWRPGPSVRRPTWRQLLITLGQVEEGWQVQGTLDGTVLGPVSINLNAVRADVARVFRDWAARGDWMVRGRVTEPDQVRLLGGILFRAIFPGEIRKALRDLLRGEQRIAVDLYFEPDLETDLTQLPWEYLYAPDQESVGELHFAFDSRVTLTRVSSPSPLPEQRPRSSLSIGVVSATPSSGNASPDGASQRVAMVANNVSTVLRGLDNLRVRNAEITNDRPPSRNDVSKMLQGGRYDVIHYVGFGEFRDGEELVAMPSNRADGYEFVSFGSFVNTFTGTPPRLVVLELCENPNEEVSADFSIMAQSLLGRGVQAVVAYQFPIPPTLTVDFNTDLYVALADDGISVQEAVQKARATLGYSGDHPRARVSPALFTKGTGLLVLVAPPRQEGQGGRFG